MEVTRMRFVARFDRRWLISGIALVVAALLSLVVFGNRGEHVYRNGALGFRFDYSTGLQARSTDRDVGEPLGPYSGSIQGAIVINKAARGIFGLGGDDFVWADLTPEAVVFELTRSDVSFSTPSSEVDQNDARFPLQAASFKSLKGDGFLNSDLWRGYRFSANGSSFFARVYVGPRASKADRAAIWHVVSSLRFDSLRTGQTTDDGALVLKKEGSYSVGAVEYITANTFLVRGTRAFYAIIEPEGSPSINFPCPLRFDRSSSEFACKGTPYRWDLMGRPIRKDPDSISDRLDIQTATVGQDGHVLLTGALHNSSRALERKLWGDSLR